jgi:DNA-binding response OmpR family regulator
MRNILVIEDSDDINLMYKAFLPREQYMLTIVHKLADIPALIEPSLIILDLWLPNGQGIETVRRVRKRFPCHEGAMTPILVVTAFDEVDIEDLIAAGADDVLYKGTLPREKLLEMIRKTIRRREVWEETNEEWLAAECKMRHIKEVLAEAKTS